MASFSCFVLPCVIFGCLNLPIATAQDFERAREANWHQWRGPNADGVALNAAPPLDWSATQNVLWKVPIPGYGSASPVVWGDSVFVATAELTDTVAPEPPQKQDYQIPGPPRNLVRYALVCVDRRTGRIKWDRTAVRSVAHEGHHKTHSFAAASPITNGKHVFVSFGSRGVFAFDFDGNRVWRRDLGDMQTRRGWGEGASPALHEDTLIVNWDHEGRSALFALDASNGKTRWRVARDEPTSWSTPLIVRDDNVTQVIVSATNRMMSYELRTGDVLWQCTGLSINVIPSPVAADGIVYCMSNYRESAAYAIRLSSRGNLRHNGSILWTHTGGTPYCPSPLLHRGRLYFTSRNTSVLTVLDAATGKPTGPSMRLGGLRTIYGSPVAAGNHVFVTSRAGRTIVLRAGDQPQIVGTNDIGEPVDASPAVVGGQFFLRGHRTLFCIAKSGSADGPSGR